MEDSDPQELQPRQQHHKKTDPKSARSGSSSRSTQRSRSAAKTSSPPREPSIPDPGPPPEPVPACTSECHSESQRGQNENDPHSPVLAKKDVVLLAEDAFGLGPMGPAEYTRPSTSRANLPPTGIELTFDSLVFERGLLKERGFSDNLVTTLLKSRKPITTKIYGKTWKKFLSVSKVKVQDGPSIPKILEFLQKGRLSENIVILHCLICVLVILPGVSKVQVLYGGTDLFDYEVRTTFNNDMLLAFISSSCIAVLVYVLTAFSVFLTFFGIASIGLSCLVALFLYHVAFGIQYLGILNGVAAFVIVGIGVDDVFVFINTYRQANQIRDPRQRMIHTVQTAGKATFFTSLTTASAYAANVFSQLRICCRIFRILWIDDDDDNYDDDDSEKMNFCLQTRECLQSESPSSPVSLQIPAVHDFGLFMSLIVSCCWVAVLFIMPAALGIWGAHISPLETSCHSNCSERCLRKNSLDIHEDLLAGQDPYSRPVPGTVPYLDDDIPLLSVEDDAVALEFGDVPLVSVLPDGFEQKSDVDRRDQVLQWFHTILHHCVLWTSDKGRHVTVGIFVAVLILSISFAARLHPASRAPVLFRPDTNIQLLLDLKYNLSAEGISCVTCSGLFQEKPRSLQNNIRTSSDKKKRGSLATWNSKMTVADTGHEDLQRTVYVTRCKWEGRATIYRLSLNGSAMPPWQSTLPGDDDVTSFQVYKIPYGNYTWKLTACMSTIGLQTEICPKKWMITSSGCDTRRGWKFDFSFYAADKEQSYARKLFFTLVHKNPTHGRVCAAASGCPGSGSDVSNRGFFYVPTEKGAPKKLSPTLNFNPCLNTVCGKPAVRPLVDTGAMVFVVFGIHGVNRTRVPDNHVLGELGRVIYDDKFDLFKEIGNLCRLCKVIASNRDLVKPGGAQCLPSGYSISSFLQMLHPECKNIPEPNLLPGQLSHGAVGVKDGKVQWISMAFESTTYKGKSSFQTYKDYLMWESFLQQQLLRLPADSALTHGFQTCEHWKQIFMEIVGK
ncbi:unnamed protein product [Ranitomeya imitator]|uniref:SSD domain-containing protein n=1 Tax=Ranitomeya imitator TaxID=111125 RepID=A0ABN9L9L3_9NEOB|nr:unnamed protein product [Ranitomeya imitator]